MNLIHSKILRVGTRRSLLAKAQSNWVINQILKYHSHLKIEVKEIVTTGDKFLDSFSNLPGKGVFVKEIEEHLLSDKIDLAVHSMKDLPTEMPSDLEIAVIPERVDPRDIFITRHHKDIEKMPSGSRIGTGSPRRKAQLLNFRSDLEVIQIRGNIDTRLKKAQTDEYDGIVLAAAGLIRKGWQKHIQQYLSCGVMIPAVGQGALGIEIRSDDAATRELITPLNDPISQQTVNAEREFLKGMGGGCQTPLAAFCRERSGRVDFQAFCAAEDGSNFHKEQIEGKIDDAMLLADELVKRLKNKFEKMT